jgi:hypothetical protein
MIDRDKIFNALRGIKHPTVDDRKVPIKRGCPNKGGCFCTGACKEIIGYRDKLPNEY